MTGVIESVVIGGAAWGALETYRDTNEKKKQQRKLIQELFAKFFQKDFEAVAPDKTTHLRTLKSGTDTDVISAYHFLHHYQEKRTKNLLQEIWSGGEEARNDTLTMVTEYLKQWLQSLPKANEIKTTKTDYENVVEIKNHIEFSRQLLMRPKLFKNGKENNFGVAIAHFSEHVEKFYNKINTSTVNTSNVLDQILTIGKELISQSCLPIMLFTIANVVSDDKQLPCFDAVTLVQAFQQDCDRVRNVGSSASGAAGDQQGSSITGVTSSSSRIAKKDKNGAPSTKNLAKNVLAWHTHVGKLLYLFLRTNHFRNLMETAEGISHPDEFPQYQPGMMMNNLENGTAGGTLPLQLQNGATRDISNTNTDQTDQSSTVNNNNTSSPSRNNNKNHQDVEEDSEYPCYLNEADINGDYLPGYNFEPTSMDKLRAENLKKQEQLDLDGGGDHGDTTGDNSLGAGANKAANILQDLFYRKPDRQKFDQLPPFKEFLNVVKRAWDVHLEFEESGLLPKYRHQASGILLVAQSSSSGASSINADPALIVRTQYLDFFRKCDDLVYFLSILQIYARLSALGGDPLICYLYSTVQHLLHEMEILLTELYRIADHLSEIAKETLQEFAKNPSQYSKESDLRYMQLLQFLDFESFKQNHKKLFLLFTELRSLSANERIPYLKQSIEANLSVLASTMQSENFQTRCALPVGNLEAGFGLSLTNQQRIGNMLSDMVGERSFSRENNQQLSMNQQQRSAIGNNYNNFSPAGRSTPGAASATTSNYPASTRGAVGSSSAAHHINTDLEDGRLRAALLSKVQEAEELDYSAGGEMKKPLSEISMWDPDGGATGEFYYGEGAVEDGLVKNRVSQYESTSTGATPTYGGRNISSGAAGAAEGPPGAAAALRSSNNLSPQSRSNKTAASCSSSSMPVVSINIPPEEEMRSKAAAVVPSQTAATDRTTSTSLNKPPTLSTSTSVGVQTDSTFNVNYEHLTAKVTDFFDQNANIFTTSINYATDRNFFRNRIKDLIKSLPEKNLTENETAFYLSIWNLLADFDSEESDFPVLALNSERWEKLLLRTGLSKKYTDAVVESILVGTGNDKNNPKGGVDEDAQEDYNSTDTPRGTTPRGVDNFYGGFSPGGGEIKTSLTPRSRSATTSTIDYPAFAAILRLLAHSQELEQKEHNGEEFYFSVQDVPFYHANESRELVAFLERTPPELVKFDKLEWNQDLKRLKIREPF